MKEAIKEIQMKRYCKQRKGTGTCVPVALINALKWKGWNFTMADLPDLKKKVKWKRGTGAYMRDAYRYLIESKFVDNDDIRLVSDHTPFPRVLIYQNLRKTIEKGGAALLSYESKPNHCYFIDAKDGHYYRCINDDWNNTIKWRHVNTIKHRKHNYLIALR